MSTSCIIHPCSRNCWSKRKFIIITPSDAPKPQTPKLLCNELRHAPVLETAVWEVSSDYERDFSLGELLDGNLQGIRLAVEGDENRRVHTVAKPSWSGWKGFSTRRT